MTEQGPWIIERGRRHSTGGHAIILHSTDVAANWSFVTEEEFERYVAGKEETARTLREAWEEFKCSPHQTTEESDE